MWLFLDFDGTLVDSLNVARQVYERFVESCGGRPDDEEFRALNGPSLSEIVDLIADRRELAGDRGPLRERYSSFWSEAYPFVSPKRGASELLHEARKRGLELAIVSSARTSFLRPYLSQQRWDALVACVVSGDEVTRSKPDSEIYRLALHRTGAAASDVEVLEDAVNGVRSAVGAGIAVVALADGGSYGATAEQLLAAGAARVIAALSEFFEGRP